MTENSLMKNLSPLLHALSDGKKKISTERVGGKVENVKLDMETQRKGTGKQEKDKWGLGDGEVKSNNKQPQEETTARQDARWALIHMPYHSFILSVPCLSTCIISAISTGLCWGI